VLPTESNLTKEFSRERVGPPMLWLAAGLVVLFVGSGLFHWGLASGGVFEADTVLFLVVGLVFLVLTGVAHLWSMRSIRRSRSQVVEGQGGASQHVAATVLVPTAIRMVGTFAVLGVVIWLDVASRPEAVFDVLFWYVTLTALEVAGIVWASRVIGPSNSHSSTIVKTAIAN